MIDAELQRSEALTWVCVLMDQAFHMPAELNLLKAQLVTAAENRKQKLNQVAKLLIVSEPTKTTMFLTLKTADVIQQVKRMLKALVQRFGDEVLRRADKTLHPMNLKDKHRIENWKLASELKIDEEIESKEDVPKRARRKGPACLANLREWAEEAEEASLAIPETSSAIVVMENRLTMQTRTVEILTKELHDLQLKEEEVKRRDDPKKKIAALQRIDKLQFAMNTTTGEERKLDLGYEIRKVQCQLDDARSDSIGQLDKIATERHALKKTLELASLEAEDMKEWCNQAVLEVLDSGRVVPLYVISKMKEEDRDDMIAENLPLDTKRKVNAFQTAKREGKESEAKKQLSAVSRDVLNASLKMMDDGSLPDFKTNRDNKARFVDRVMKVAKAITGAELDREEVKKALNKEKKKECAVCQRRTETYFWDLDGNRVTEKPDENTTAHVVGLCGSACFNFFRLMPVCSKCKSDSNNEHVKKPGDGLPNPAAIMLMGFHTQSILKIESQMHQSKGLELQELQRRLRGETAEVESAEQKSLLPNLYCVKCDEKCVPRDMTAMGKYIYEAFPWIEPGHSGRPDSSTAYAKLNCDLRGVSMAKDAKCYQQQRKAREEFLKRYAPHYFNRELYSNQQDDVSMPQCSSE